ncbi:hypothetical protein RJ641_025244 [Dillenia turbinata]|uniref:Uncharacterized protein n=1 Tax=Dillenia turbinata TaxID=194707 RepID=A0AAN8WDX5_9MAGN
MESGKAQDTNQKLTRPESSDRPTDSDSGNRDISGLTRDAIWDWNWEGIDCPLNSRASTNWIDLTLNTSVGGLHYHGGSDIRLLEDAPNPEIFVMESWSGLRLLIYRVSPA